MTAQELVEQALRGYDQLYFCQRVNVEGRRHESARIHASDFWKMVYNFRWLEDTTSWLYIDGIDCTEVLRSLSLPLPRYNRGFLVGEG